MHANFIVSRIQTGKPTPYRKKIDLLELFVAYHLGLLKNVLVSRRKEEYVLFKADETFFVDLNDGKTLSMHGDKNVIFADVVSDDVPREMMITFGCVLRYQPGIRFIILTLSAVQTQLKESPAIILGTSIQAIQKGEWIHMFSQNGLVKSVTWFQCQCKTAVT